jgi:Domain of unknown function (DUF4936)
MQTALRQEHPRLSARLYQRDGIRDGLVTLMETYAMAGGHVDAGLQATIEVQAASLLAPWCQGSRHTEAFDELST